MVRGSARTDARGLMDVAFRSDVRAQRGSPCQRHIRQHMTTRPAIMVPAVPFASQADRERAGSVMWPIMTECVSVRQIALRGAADHDEM